MRGTKDRRNPQGRITLSALLPDRILGSRPFSKGNTHLGASGLPEYPEAEDVAESLRQNGRITFYWE